MSDASLASNPYRHQDPDEAYSTARRRITNNAVRRQQQSINLSGYGLVRLPPEIGDASRLTSLDLSGNMLTALPAEIGNLAELHWLDVSHNQLASLPKEISNLSSLLHLNVNYNKILSLPCRKCAISMDYFVYIFLRTN